jgi:hypothetical protein
MGNFVEREALAQGRRRLSEGREVRVHTPNGGWDQRPAGAGAGSRSVQLWSGHSSRSTGSSCVTGTISRTRVSTLVRRSNRTAPGSLTLFTSPA